MISCPQIKMWMQETGHEIYYVGWVWEGNSDKSDEDSSSDISQPWLTWRPKVLAFRGSNLYYMEYPPVQYPRPLVLKFQSHIDRDCLIFMHILKGWFFLCDPCRSLDWCCVQGVGSDWDGGQIYPVITTLLRVLNSASEHLDERQHCFTLQIATEQNSFPPNGSRQQPITFYLST